MRAPFLASALRRRAAFSLALLFVSACSPRFDWRESRPQGSGALLLFPCRPDPIERIVLLAGSNLRMQMNSCSAGGARFSLAVADAAVGERVPALLAAWREQTLGNVSGVATAWPLPFVAGATPGAPSASMRVAGHLPDGRPVVEHTAFFVKGTRLYQATVMETGKPVGQEALDSFFGAIRLP